MTTETIQPATTTRAWRALIELDALRPGGKFTTAQIAKHAGATDWTAGRWTEPWRFSLFALMLAGLVNEPTGRPHHWRLSAAGRKQVGA